jgi:outer membrane protein
MILRSVTLVIVIALPWPAVAANRIVTLAQALAAAESHPDVALARANRAAGEARAQQAFAPLLPQVSGAATYQAGSDPVNGPSHSTQDLNGGLNVGLLVWDFGKTSSRWRAAEASASAQEQDVKTAELTARKLACAAFFAARARRALLAVAQETFANEERHLQQIERFVAAQTRPDIDLYQAKTTLATARATLVQAENDYEIAKAQLNDAMGVEEDTDYDIADESMPPIDKEEATPDVLLREALEARPEIASIVNFRRAQEITVDASRSAWWPALRAGAGVNGVALGSNARTWGWTSSLMLAWDLYDGGLRSGAIAEANAMLAGFDARSSALRHRLLLEVQTARLAVRSARGSVEAASEALKNARIRLVLAEKRYAAGLGSAIELTDAQVEVTRTAGALVQTEYNLASARGQLRDALGRSP